MTTREEIKDHILQLKGDILEKEIQLQKLEKVYGKMKEGDTTPISMTSSIHGKGESKSCSNNQQEMVVPNSPIQNSLVHSKDITTPLGEIFLSKGNPTQLAGHQATKEIILSPQTQRVSKYYVLFSGPNQGIYTEWAKIAPLIEKKNHHQSFYDHEEAQKAFFTYKRTSESQKTFSEMAQTPSPRMMRPPLRPPTPIYRSFDSSIPNIPDVIRNRINKSSRLNIIDETSSITKEKFFHYWTMAEASDESSDLYFFTIDKRNISFYAFFEKAKPEIVKEVYDCGLLALVYPSNNLLELSLLPKPIFHAIKNFRTKVIGDGERNIYVKFTSSLLDWNETEYFLPYHWIEVGLAKNDVKFKQPETRKTTDDIENLARKLRPSRLKAVYQKYTEVFADSKKKINYYSNKTIVISNFSITITTKELQELATNEACFLDGKLGISEETKQRWCDSAPRDHLCHYCINKEKTEKDDDTSSTTGSFFEDI